MAFVSTALTVALALGIDWIAAEWLGIGSADTRWWLLAATLMLVCGSFTFLLGREWSARHKVTDDLAQLERNEASPLARTNAGFRDHTQAGDDLHQAVERLQAKMRGLSQRAEELECERTRYERLAKSHEAQSRQVRSVLSALAEPVLVTDKRDQLVLSNSSANRLLSITPSNGERQALASLVRCQELVDLLHDTRCKQAFTQGAHEIEVTAPDGTPRWYRVTTRNIPTQPGDSDPDGTSQGAVALLHDISSQRRLQKRNSEFVTAVSHEMKTPLATIAAYTELLADGEADTPQSQQQFLRVIASQVDRLSQLVNNLVDLARIEADLTGEKQSRQPLSQLIDEAVAALRPLAESKQLEFEVRHASRTMELIADRQLMLQAIAHLVSNAIKYTPPGGRVTLSCRRAGELAVIEVADTGIGINDQQLKRVFEKFYRVAESKDMAEGSGLGLPLVKHIVEDVHGGGIELESSPGVGTTARLVLRLPPLGQEHGPANDGEDSPHGEIST